MSAGRLAMPRNSTNRDRRTDITDLVPTRVSADAALVEKQRRVAAARIELRFGPNSDVARMLGLVAS